MNSRIAWIDQLKGLMLFIVIVEHVGIIPSYLETSLYFLGAGAMPVYFALCGYLFSNQKEPTIFFRGKLLSLFLPYVLISLLLVVFDPNIYKIDGMDYLFNEVYRIFIMGVSASKGTPLWFVYTLFFICCVSYCIFKYCTNVKFLITLAISLSVTATMLSLHHINLFFNLETLIAAYPFFIMGYIVKQENVISRIHKYGRGNTTVLCIIIISLLFSAVIYTFYPLASVLHANIPHFLSLYGLGSFLTIALVLIFFSSSINIYILKYLALNGMAFLGFHAYFQLGVLALCKK